jgi:hypothetical protein
VQGDLSSRLYAAAAGLTWLPARELTAGFGVRAEDSPSTHASSRSRGVDASVHYQRPVPLGEAQLSYAVRYDRREQLASAPNTNVIGERVTLAGLAVVALSRQRVTAGSVVVSNATRSQTFAEGRDYVLSVVGVETRLQRVVGGNIVDGEEVLVDYAYDLGGSFSYAQRDQTANLNWSLLRWFNLYARYFDSTPRLFGGEPVFPLNEIRSRLYGARADAPFRWLVPATAGFSFEREDRDETFAPSERNSQEWYVQSDDPFFATGGLRLATRRTRIDYANSVQDVNLRGVDVRYWSRWWYGLELSADASYEIDTGAPLERRRTISLVKAQWRYRKLSLTLDFGRTREIQGDLELVRYLVQFLARRDL